MMNGCCRDGANGAGRAQQARQLCLEPLELLSDVYGALELIE